MKTILLAPGLKLPLDAATETFGIFGQKGSGKSTTATRFIEQLVVAGGRAVVVDPTGVHYGLMHDGTGPGLAGIVLGGEHGDIPLDPNKGHVVAEFVVAQSTYPVVVLDLKLMRKADRTRFMLAFLETLYHENREALHLVLDEAHQFAPTQARDGGDQIKLLGAVEDVVALGRSRGLGITMISQRFATLNANVREQIGTLIVHRLIGSLDRKALRGWIEANGDPSREKEVMETMAKLGTGRALVWSPAFLDYFGVVAVDPPGTFDSRATPKVGQRVKRPGKRAVVNLDTLRERMAETIAEADANDPIKLRQQIERLRLELANERHSVASLEHLKHREPEKVVEKVVETKIERIEVPVFSDQARAHLTDAIDKLALGVRQAADLAESIEQKLGRVEQPQLGGHDLGTPAPRPPTRHPVAQEPRQPAPRPSAPLADVTVRSPQRNGNDLALGDTNLRSGERKMLATLARSYPIRLSEAQLGTLARFARKGGTFGAYMRTLKRLGLVEKGSDNLLTITDLGLSAAGVVPGNPMSADEIREQYRTALRAGERAMFDALTTAYPDEMSMQMLAEETGFERSGGTFGAYVRTLRRNGLVATAGETIRATPTAMGQL